MNKRDLVLAGEKRLWKGQRQRARALKAFLGADEIVGDDWNGLLEAALVTFKRCVSCASLTSALEKQFLVTTGKTLQIKALQSVEGSFLQGRGLKAIYQGSSRFVGSSEK